MCTHTHVHVIISTLYLTYDEFALSVFLSQWSLTYGEFSLGVSPFFFFFFFFFTFQAILNQSGAPFIYFFPTYLQ